MSQNPPRGPYDNDFLNENVDLEIAHPSPNAEIYTLRPRRACRLRHCWLQALRCLPYLRVGYTSMPFSKEYRRPAQFAAGRTGRKRPIKVPAEELPEGQVEEPRPLNIHDVANGKAEMPALSDEIVEAARPMMRRAQLRA